MNRVKRFAALGGICALAACSNGGSILVPPAAQNAVPAAAHGSGNATATANVTIIWPKKPNSSRRRAAFTSPSTVSIVVQTAGSNGSTVTGVANDTGKTASSTVSIQAPVGSDTFFVTLYDRPQRANETVPVGNELGEATVTRKILAGQTNTVPFTANGLVSLVSIALASPSPLASIDGKAGSQTVTLIGDAAHTFVLTPLDADGNAIVAPGKVPSFSLVTGGRTGSLLSIAHVAKKPNDFTIKAVAPRSNNSFTPISGAIALVATATDALGPHTTDIATTLINEVFVGYQGGRKPRIGVYDGDGNSIVLSPGAFKGVTTPIGLAYDPDDHEIIVADASNKVLAFNTDGSAVQDFSSPGLSGITAIAYYNDASGREGTIGLRANKRRILVADAQDGFDELDPKGDLLVRAGGLSTASGTSFVPTSIAGVVDDLGPSTSGAIVAVGDAVANSIDSYDMQNPNPTHTGVPLKLPYFSDALEGGYAPVGIATAIVGYESETSCNSGGSNVPNLLTPETFIIASTGTVGSIDFLQGLCYYGVYAPSYQPSPYGKNLTGLAIDNVHGGFYAIDTGGNGVDDYIVEPFPPKLSASETFYTPILSGLLNPSSIAVAF
jgi:hypothetical protein